MVDLKSPYYSDKWKQKLENKLDMFVATINDYPIAYIWADWTKYSALRVGEISSFEVMQPFRGLGIGSEMILEMEKILRAKNLQTSQTGANQSNTGAINLYQKLGYEIVSASENRNQKIDKNGNVSVIAELGWQMQKSLL